MQINNSKPISGVVQNSNVESQKAAENINQTEVQKAKTDKMDFSYHYEKEKVNLISKVEHDIISDVSKNDQTKKIEELKMKIQSNEYKIDPSAIAKSMLSLDDELN